MSSKMNLSRSDSKKKSFRGIIDSKPGRMPWPIADPDDTEDLDPLLASTLTIARKDAQEGPCTKFLSGIFNAIQSYSQVILLFIAIVVVGGLEKIIHDFCFKCPCFIINSNNTAITSLTETDPKDHNFTAGFAFLAIPPGILFMIGVGLNRKTWKLVTGCMNKNERTRNDIGTACNVIVEVFLISMVAPITWLAIAFLEGDYYVCALSVNPCQDTGTAFFHNAGLRGESQVIGLAITLAAAIATVVVMIGHRCRNKASYYHQRFLATYQKSERDEMVRIAKEFGKQNARVEWCRMIRAGTEIHWDAVSRFYFPPDPDDATEDRARRPFMSALDKTVLQSLGEEGSVPNGNNKVAPNAVPRPAPGVANPTYREEMEVRYAPQPSKIAPSPQEYGEQEKSRPRSEGRRKKKSYAQPYDEEEARIQPTSEL